MGIEQTSNIDDFPVKKCILFKGTKNGMGYGVFKMGGRGFSLLSAHRVSFRLFKGPIKKGREICHKCDNPFCVNPNHLFMGTHEGNMADASKKLRLPNSKLNPTKIIEIRKRYFFGESSRKLGNEFDVSHNTILNIKNKKGWKHV